MGRQQSPHRNYIGFVSQKDKTVSSQELGEQKDLGSVHQETEEQRRKLEGQEDDGDITNLLAPGFLLDAHFVLWLCVLLPLPPVSTW